MLYNLLYPLSVDYSVFNVSNTSLSVPRGRW